MRPCTESSWCPPTHPPNTSVRGARSLLRPPGAASIPFQPASSPRVFQPKPIKLPSGGQWLHEIKHDPFRMLMRREAAGVLLFTCNGHELPTDRPTSSFSSNV